MSVAVPNMIGARQNTPARVAAAARAACMLEVSAEKPGNVTQTRPFKDMEYRDFVRSAEAIAPEMGRAGERAVGRTILAAVAATRRRTQANTNLGIVLLFAPVARAALAPGAAALRPALANELQALTVADADAVYSAIRLANPGGLEEQVDHDVRRPPRVSLREAMASAVERDSIAAEYLSDYAITFERGLPALRQAQARAGNRRQAVVQTYLELLAAVPDTLIARKQGMAVAQAVSETAAQVLASGGTYSAQGRQAIARFDDKLRQGEGKLNPGTTADLVAVTLFIAFLEGILK